MTTATSLCAKNKHAPSVSAALVAQETQQAAKRAKVDPLDRMEQWYDSHQSAFTRSSDGRKVADRWRKFRESTPSERRAMHLVMSPKDEWAMGVAMRDPERRTWQPLNPQSETRISSAAVTQALAAAKDDGISPLAITFFGHCGHRLDFLKVDGRKLYVDDMADALLKAPGELPLLVTLRGCLSSYAARSLSQKLGEATVVVGHAMIGAVNGWSTFRYWGPRPRAYVGGEPLSRATTQEILRKSRDADYGDYLRTLVVRTRDESRGEPQSAAGRQLGK